jgi:hypothetical protein
MDLEREYTALAISALKPIGHVLEVGFGDGYAAEQIQRFTPLSHTIVAPCKDSASKARGWAKSFSGITVIEGAWETLLSDLGEFDAIFFNDPPLKIQLEGIRALAESGLDKNKIDQMVQKLQQQLAAYAHVRFSKSDFDDFYATHGKDHISKIPTFLQQLKQNGQLSDETHRDICECYQLPQETYVGSDPLLDFLRICLDRHMKSGSRFAALTPLPISNYESPRFFDQIITNPYITYFEELIPLGSEKVLVMTVEKCT